MGASIFENHVMFDDQDFGYDRAVSMPLSSVEKFINSLRDTDIMLGSHLKQLSKSEQINRKNNRKSLHFNRVMKKNDVISSGDLIALRPGKGISPAKIDAVVGKKLLKNVEDRELLEWQMFA
jgi:sialic acid synthase SpsE